MLNLTCRLNQLDQFHITSVFCSTEFPLRLQTKETPSLGTMEIYENDTWKKLCMATWETAEENLTCQAIGYSNIDVYDNSTTSNTTVHHNCTSLTNCPNDSDGNFQKCKGMYQEIQALAQVPDIQRNFQEKCTSNKL